MKCRNGDGSVTKGVDGYHGIYADSPPRKVPAGAPPAPPGPTGRGTRRPLLLVASQRGGPVLVKRIASHGRKAIDAALAGYIDPAATIVTDGLPAYAHLGATHPSWELHQKTS